MSDIRSVMLSEAKSVPTPIHWAETRSRPVVDGTDICQNHEAILRIHHDESLKGALHRRHEQPPRRVDEHKRKVVRGFTAKHNITRLVHYEVATNVHAAIAREKQIKG